MAFLKGFFPLVATLLISSVAFGFGKPEHSTVEVTNQKDGESVAFTFKIKAKTDHVITFDAPWQLEIKDHNGLKFSETKLKKDKMDEKLPGYVVKTTGTPSTAKGELEYRLTSFICTADKTKCYREVHKGKTNWAKQ